MLTKNLVHNKFKIWLVVAMVLGAAILAIAQLVYADPDRTVNAPKSDLRATIDTPLGEEVFQLTSMSGSEEISRLFQYQLEMVSHDPAIDPKKIVGQKLTLTIVDESRLKLGSENIDSRVKRSKEWSIVCAVQGGGGYKQGAQAQRECRHSCFDWDPFNHFPLQ